jgi:hypothetical protein
MRVVITVLLLLAIAVPAAAGADLPQGGSFVDDDGSVHEPDIEAIATAGVTNGCGPELFCPRDGVTRGQMAAFLVRLLALPVGDAGRFDDTAGSAFEAEVDALAAAGITTGCTETLFCPDAGVTRGEMAVFLTRAFELPISGGDVFTDDDDSPYEPQIDAVAAAGITLGCEPGRFCPGDVVTREQMASFLTRAAGLDPIPVDDRCRILPSDNIWNARVDLLDVHPDSADYVASIGLDRPVHPDFGSGVWPPGSNSPIGIPFIEVGPATVSVPIDYVSYGDESDPGPFPIPLDAPIEGGPDGTGDRHVIALDRDACMLYELFDARAVGDGWQAASGARFDLTSNVLRPEGWTSADAAGLPIFPGLVRYEEVAVGSIEHAIRFTAPQTRRAFVWPARHFASADSDPALPPMGQRFRLRAGFDTSGFHPDVEVILDAMKRYGLILADNGSSWFVSGAPDPRWDNDALRQLRQLTGADFEAVDVSSLQISSDSGAAHTAP